MTPHKRLSRLAHDDASAAAPNLEHDAPEPDVEAVCRCIDPLLTDF